MFKLLSVLFVVCVLSCTVLGDMYLQNPRGCNDRLNEEGDRQNDKRLFDSENNARGGYCWGPAMKFYEGSILPIEWTAQHGCGGEHVTCTEIIQYMCDPNIRDGTETTTIPDDINQINAKNDKGEFRYGMQESFESYQDCKNRERNKGLFLADQNLANNGKATQTRQNPGGARYGFECTEERDYYPYWHPSQWKDIAVLTEKLDHCPFYQSESQNVKDKNFCSGIAAGTTIPNNDVACGAAGGKWEVQKSFGIPPPDCRLADFSRDNHLGNTLNAETANYTWVLPDEKIEPCIADGTCNCAIRIRYNITTNESSGLRDSFLDARNNSKNSPVKNNPTFITEGGELTLALNTAQFGRTFQDRSYMFNILPRPKGVSSTTKIYNLNVRGKRGNIVQTFPATEYDFVPGRLVVQENDMVHFQWTGCDTNPGGNQGEGKVKTDRSNIVQIKDLDSNIPVVNTNHTVEKLMFEDAAMRNKMALLGQTGCVAVADLIKELGNADQANQDVRNCAKLNAAPTPYFDGGLVKMSQTGKFTYMSTRNNNFSNRTQKGQLTVVGKEDKLHPAAVAAIVIVCIAAVGAALGGVIFYGKKNPHSAVGRAVDNVRMPNFTWSSSSSSSASSSSASTGARRLPLLHNDHGMN